MSQEPTQTQIDASTLGFQMLPRDAKWDERVLHFLKELPAWVIISLLVGFLVMIWLRTASAQIESYIGQGLAALLTAVVTNRNRPGVQSVDNSFTADVIKTPQVKAETMNDTVVNVRKDTEEPAPTPEDATDDTIPFAESEIASEVKTQTKASGSKKPSQRGKGNAT